VDCFAQGAKGAPPLNLTRSLAVLVLALAVPSAARAGNESIVAFGIGAHTTVSVLGAVSSSGSAYTTGGLGFTARLRLARVIGAEVSYEMTGGGGSDPVNVSRPVYQLSALVYLYSSMRVSVFVLGGLGATSIGDIVDVGGSTTSYHGGAGLEVGLNKHWMIAADGRINLPGYMQVINRVEPQALIQHGSNAMMRYYNLDSFQINLGVRYYI
jgi:hypothetical protein